MTAYVARSQKLQRELRASGAYIENSEVVEAVLEGLPHHFKTLRQVLREAGLTHMSLDQLLLKLQDYQDNEPDEDEVRFEDNSAAMFAKHKKGGKADTYKQQERKCYVCGKPGHRARQCRYRKGSSDDEECVAKASTATALQAAAYRVAF